MIGQEQGGRGRLVILELVNQKTSDSVSIKHSLLFLGGASKGGGGMLLLVSLTPQTQTHMESSTDYNKWGESGISPCSPDALH